MRACEQRSSSGKPSNVPMTRLVLIRHPEVAVEPGVCYGQSDVPLRMPAHDSARLLAAGLERSGLLLPGHDPDPDALVSLHSSPLSRCALVAGELGRAFGLDVRMDPDLMEIHYGRWEQRRWDDVDRSLLDAWAADLDHGRPHGGESAAMLRARVARWVEQTDDDGARTIVAVTHAGVIRMLAAHLLAEPIEAALRRPLGFGSWSVFVGAACGERSAPSSMRRWILEAWDVAGESDRG